MAALCEPVLFNLQPHPRQKGSERARVNLESITIVPALFRSALFPL